MRIAILTDEIYPHLFGVWRRTIERLRERHEFVGMALFPYRLKHLHGQALACWYVRHFGAPVAAKLVAHSLWSRLREPSGYAGLCRSLDIPCVRGATPNAPWVSEWVREARVDVLLISLAHVLSGPILEAPRVAILNRHGSILPAYRGLFPAFWTLLEEQAPIGATIHRVTGAIDAGPILVQRAYPSFHGSVNDAYAVMNEDTPGLFSLALRALETGEVVRYEPVPRESYRSVPNADAVRAFRARGLRFI